MSMDRNAVLGVTSLDSLLLFAESYLESSPGLPTVNLPTNALDGLDHLHVALDGGGYSCHEL